MILKDNFKKLPPKERIQTVAELIEHTLDEAKRVGVDSESAAMGLLTACVRQMVKAIGPVATSRLLLDLAKGVMVQVEKSTGAKEESGYVN